MRISSGPSCVKLKPRTASSSCGDDTPRSSNTPSNPPIKPSSFTTDRQTRKLAINKRQSSVVHETLPTRQNRLRVAIDRNDPPPCQLDPESQPCDRHARRPIEIATFRSHLERHQHFIQKYWRVFQHRPTIHPPPPPPPPRCYSDSEASSGGSSSVGSSAFSHCSRLSFHCASSQSSKRLP